MKSFIIYHSLSGNTKQIAEAIHSGMRQLSDDVTIKRMEEVNSNELSNYDLIGIGSFVQSFQEPVNVTEFINAMSDLTGKYVFTFCTHETAEISMSKR